MRPDPLATAILAASLIALAGCNRQPQTGAATANADAIADKLEAKANNYSMMADNSTSSEAAIALENVSGSLDDQSANLRVEANPKDTVK